MGDKKEFIAVKAGMWYTISNFIIRSLSIISIPIFTRIMSISEYGEYNNFASWLTIITILATMDLHSTINRARFDFKENVDGYISSITITSLIIPALFYLVVSIFPTFFSALLNMDIFCMHFMFISVIFSSTINIYQAKQRVNYEYKKSVFITFMSSILTVVTSIFLVLSMENKLYGRVIGQTMPAIIINLILAVYLIKKGKKFDIKYAKYAIIICLPYIPHLLAMNILSQYDRIQINQFCGSEAVGMYSLAYSCAIVINIFLNSLNNAWSPWLGEMINGKQYDKIKNTSKIYTLVFFAIGIGIFLIAPEILLILGGKNYSMAIYVMPPIIAGSIFQFIYTLYVNVEMFEKKVWGVAFATMIAAGINILLNMIFINKFGYIAAAFTTLFCYILLCLLHYFQVRRLKLTKIYDTKFLVWISIATLAITGLAYVLYFYSYIRYVAIILYGSVLLYILNKNRKTILNILKKDKKHKEEGE